MLGEATLPQQCNQAGLINSAAHFANYRLLLGCTAAPVATTKGATLHSQRCPFLEALPAKLRLVADLLPGLPWPTTAMRYLQHVVYANVALGNAPVCKDCACRTRVQQRWGQRWLHWQYCSNTAVPVPPAPSKLRQADLQTLKLQRTLPAASR